MARRKCAGKFAAEAAGATRGWATRLHWKCLAYGETCRLGNESLSLHPAGHVLGSAQVRVEHRGEVWVVAGDYFVSGAGDCNTTCAPFEPVRCDVFVTVSTFGLPIYRRAPLVAVLDEMRAWWMDCAAQGRHALLMGYSLGKAQRLIAGLLTADAPGPGLVHGAVARPAVVNRWTMAFSLPGSPSLPTLRGSATQVRGWHVSTGCETPVRCRGSPTSRCAA